MIVYPYCKVITLLLKIFSRCWNDFYVSQKVKVKMKWIDLGMNFTLTFWRNEKVNHLVKIISWCKQCVHLAWIHCRDITLWIECKQGCSVLYVCCMCVVYALHTRCVHLACIHNYKVNDLLESWLTIIVTVQNFCQITWRTFWNFHILLTIHSVKMQRHVLNDCITLYILLSEL